MEGPHVMTLWTREYKPSLTTPESDAHLWRVGRIGVARTACRTVKGEWSPEDDRGLFPGGQTALSRKELAIPAAVSLEGRPSTAPLHTTGPKNSIIITPPTHEQ